MVQFSGELLTGDLKTCVRLFRREYQHFERMDHGLAVSAELVLNRLHRRADELTRQLAESLHAAQLANRPVTLRDGLQVAIRMHRQVTDRLSRMDPDSRLGQSLRRVVNYWAVEVASELDFTLEEAGIPVT